MFFEYGETEINFLKSRDEKLAAAIDKIGHVYREVEEDLFSTVVRTVVGQQISGKAQKTVWDRMENFFGQITPEKIFETDRGKLRSFGMSFRKVECIKNFAEKISSGEFDLAAVEKMPDDDATEYISSLKGCGVWTAEMVLIFCLRRKNIFSFTDGGIIRGLKILYSLDKVSRKTFEINPITQIR